VVLDLQPDATDPPASIPAHGAAERRLRAASPLRDLLMLDIKK
jgi:hypothetical protein